MTVDLGRTDVYAAEMAAFDGTSYESVVPFGELVVLAGSVTSAPWWPRGPIQVVAARSDAASSSTVQHSGRPPVVRLAGPQMTPATTVHELAHVLAGVGEGHGPLFRRAHVDLAGSCFGGEPAGWLEQAYGAIGLIVGERRWPVPSLPRAADGPIAL